MRVIDMPKKEIIALFSTVLRDTSKELGCEPDDGAILDAISALKNRLCLRDAQIEGITRERDELRERLNNIGEIHEGTLERKDSIVEDLERDLQQHEAQMQELTAKVEGYESATNFVGQGKVEGVTGRCCVSDPPPLNQKVLIRVPNSRKAWITSDGTGWMFSSRTQTNWIGMFGYRWWELPE